MGQNTKIQWCHHTMNPWRGCTKVSPGCAHCYADAQAKRNPSVLGIWGDRGNRVVASEAIWREPLKWDRAAAAAGERHRVFCASMADVCEEWAGVMMGSNDVILGKDYRASRGSATRLTMSDVRMRLFELIGKTPHLDWLLLTKRPEVAVEHWSLWAGYAYGGAIAAHCEGAYHGDLAIPNVWLGVSVEDQVRADERIPLLLKIPAKVRFLSCEPLLGPVDLSRWLQPVVRHPSQSSGAVEEGGSELHWVIVGGESGHNARPMAIGWAEDIIRQCQVSRVPVFMKQVGANATNREGVRHLTSDPKGGNPEEWPVVLRIREFPKE